MSEHRSKNTVIGGNMKSKSISLPYSQSTDRGKPFPVYDFSYSCVNLHNFTMCRLYFFNYSYVFIKEIQHFPHYERRRI